MDSVFAILSHAKAKVCELILSSTEYRIRFVSNLSQQGIFFVKEFSLLFPLFFFKLYSIGKY
jgi:hypothetical protein